MAKQTINIGTTPNDGTGDPLRTAFDKANDNFDELYDLKYGVYNYNDNATATVPISIPSGLGTWTHVTNDGLGAVTDIAGGYPDVTPYDTTTSLFDYTDLDVYDVVNYRFDGIITTGSANQVVTVRLLLDDGGLNVPLTFIREQYKNSGTYPIFGTISSAILSEAVRTGDAKFQISSDSSATLRVNGWQLIVMKRNQG